MSIRKKLVRPDSNRHAPNSEFDCGITRIPARAFRAIILPIKSLTSFAQS